MEDEIKISLTPSNLTSQQERMKTVVRTDQIFVFGMDGKIHYHPGGDRPMQIPAEWRVAVVEILRGQRGKLASASLSSNSKAPGNMSDQSRRALWRIKLLRSAIQL